MWRRTGGTPGSKTHKSTEAPWWPGSPQEFLSQTCPHWGSRNSSITIQVSLSKHWFPRKFQLCLGKLWFCVHLHSLQLGGQWFTLWPYFSYGPKNCLGFFFVFFLAYSVFYLLLGWNDNFEVPYTPHLGPDYCFVFAFQFCTVHSKIFKYLLN